MPIYSLQCQIPHGSTSIQNIEKWMIFSKNYQKNKKEFGVAKFQVCN